MASNNSTSFLLFQTASPFRANARNRIAVPCFTGGQIRPSKWARLQYRSGPIQSSEIKVTYPKLSWSRAGLVWKHVSKLLNDSALSDVAGLRGAVFFPSSVFLGSYGIAVSID